MRLQYILSSSVLLALAAPRIATAEWSTFHGNNQRNGLTSIVAPAVPRIKWSYDAKGPVISSPVVCPDGSIIVGATWEETKKPSMNLLAIRADGTLKWKFKLAWIENVTMSTPTVGADGRVYFGTPSGELICLNSNGVEQWRYSANSGVQSHILLAQDGNLYVQLDGKLTSFTTSGQKRWEFDLGINMPGGPTETLSGKILAVGTGIYCFNTDGTQLWHSNVAGTAASVAVSPNGDVIVGGNSVSGLNPLTGATKWDAGISAYGTYGSPAVDSQGNVYYGFDYNLYKISSNGNLLMHQYLDDPFSNYLGHTYCSPLIDGAGRIYLGLGSGKRWAIDYEKAMLVLNGSLVTTATVTFPEIPFTSSPAIGSDGTLYIGCLDGKLYALGN